MSRIAVPGADDIDAPLRQWADSRQLTVEPLGVDPGRGDDRRSGGGFTAALQNLTDHTDAITASSTAKMIGYPTTNVELQRGNTAVRTILLALASLVLAVLVGLAPVSIARARRRNAAESATPTRHGQRDGAPVSG